ncbi:MAG: sugar phosphate nucleotidyltransferase [Bacillota bacterium]
MKAVIMAGGEGSRLRPLTCYCPKPMAPVLNKPMMTYIVELLKKHGITDIGVTLQYMPENIRDYFGNGAELGVNMRYFVEDTPLGTAGSVKNTGSFLDETFVVISGDSLTDFDLTRAINFHREKGALATLVLTRVETPLEYGVVITDREGNIVRFLEKPSWGEVFSDTVNTGIYVLEPGALDYIDKGRVFDFSKDLFPLLLKEGRTVCGAILEGYWCDIGSLQQYLQAHIDVLSGKVAIDIPGTMVREGLFTGSGTEIDPAADVRGPAFIGNNCRIDGGAVIDRFSVLGDNCIVSGGATIKRSVLWNGVYVGRKAALRGAVIGSGAQLKNGASVFEGAVVGSESVIMENGVVKPDVKIWPQKVIEAGATIRNSIIWGTRFPKKVFGLDGVTGLANIEITPEYAARLAASFATVQGPGGRLAVSSDSYPQSKMIKAAIASGMQSVGPSVLDLGEGITPMHRFAVRSMGLDGGVHIKICPRNTDMVTMVFINGSGGSIARGVERKVENVMAREDFRRAEPSVILPVKTVQGVGDRYVRFLSRVAEGVLQDSGVKIVMAYDRDNLDRFVIPVCRRLGIEMENMDFSPGEETPRSWSSYREILPRLAETVVKRKATAGAVLDNNGDSLIMIDEQGRLIGDDMLTALSALVVFKSRGGPVVVPVTASDTIEKMAERYNSRVIRTKTAVQDFFENVISVDGEHQEEGAVSQFLLHFDALGALISILGFVRKMGMTLGRLADDVPSFYLNKRAVQVPWESKGTVIRSIIEEPGKQDMMLLDGVKVFHPEGWALVLPDPEEPVCRIFSEGSSMEIAESLADFYVDKIQKITGMG